MELYVRSQDKSTLLKVNELHFSDHNTFFAREHSSDLWDVLGIYATKERCLEILDEIQNLLFAPRQIVFNKCNVDKDEYNELCKQLKANGVACVKSDSEIKYLDKDWVLYEMPEK